MRHVLVADPDSREREHLRAVIERNGDRLLTIHEAEDGAQALALVQEHPMALVVCEVILNTMSGLQLLRRIQTIRPHGKTPPVILVTSMSREIDRYWGLRNGAHAYLAKPYDDKRLQDRVDMALEGGPEARPERIEM